MPGDRGLTAPPSVLVRGSGREVALQGVSGDVGDASTLPDRFGAGLRPQLRCHPKSDLRRMRPRPGQRRSTPEDNASAAARSAYSSVIRRSRSPPRAPHHMGMIIIPIWCWGAHLSDRSRRVRCDRCWWPRRVAGASTDASGAGVLRPACCWRWWGWTCCRRSYG